MAIKEGTLVSLKGNEALNGAIIGWYKASDGDVTAHIFDKKELYGIFLGDPIMSNGDPWYHVLVGERQFLFLMQDIEIYDTTKKRASPS